MTDTSFLIDRRTLLGGLGAGLLLPAAQASAQSRPSIALQAVAGTVTLKPGQPPTPIWQLAGGPDAGPLRFKRGETVDVTFTNDLPVPIALNWVGLDGNPAAEPMTGRPAIASGAITTYPITFRHAGTLLANLHFINRAGSKPTTGRAVLVTEADTVTVDRDETLVFQHWRTAPDGRSDTQTIDSADATSMFSVNGAATVDITLKQNERLRLRLINPFQATAITIKILDHDVRIMAIDGQPSEPFLARDGLVVLSPGSRVDTFIDATKAAGSTSAILLLDGREARPIGRITTSDAKPARSVPLPIAALPSNGLPAQLDLKSALRVDLPLGAADWLDQDVLTSATLPAFKVKRGRAVVLALANRGPKPAVFHLHGHHFRLLDRLDDGWKPFWLDTLAINAGQTQRIAFAAEFAGTYPMQTMATDWTAPRLFRSYMVE